MSRTRVVLLVLFALAIVGQPTDQVVAQETIASRGFNYLVPSFASGAERQGQPNLWVFEIETKNLRMVEIPITDAKTGEMKNELLYYLVYKIVNRIVEQNPEDPEKTPVNAFDKSPVPETFVPEITFASNDNGDRRAVRDSVIPEAHKFIEGRERRKLLSTVDIVQKVPQAVPLDDKAPPEIYGVAVFRGVNPDTDYFTLYLSGFSNGYKLVNGPVTYDELKTLAGSGDLKLGDQVWNGNIKADWQGAVEVGDLFNPRNDPPADAETAQYFYAVTPKRAGKSTQVWRKTVVQKYWRPGDRFNQNEKEIRNEDEPRWIYVPDDIDLKKESPVATAQSASATKP